MSEKVNRRKLLVGAGSAGLVASSGVAPAYSQGKRRLKMVTTWPKNFPGVGTAAESIAKRVEIMSEGELKIKVFAAGEIVGAFEALDAVSTGSADLYHGADYYWQGKDPAYNFFTTWPMGMTATEFYSWIDFGGGQAFWDELATKFKVKPFICGDTGTQSGGWFTKKIETLDDLKGLRMRMPGLGGEVIRRLGALPVVLSGGEIFQSLQSGAIDATEWIGPWNDQAFGFYQIAKYFYAPGFHEPNAALTLGINLDVWDSLKPTHQEHIRVACQAETQRVRTQYFYNNAVAFETLIKKHGVEVNNFSPEIMEAVKKISVEVLNELSQTSELAGRIYKSVQEHSALFNKWSLHADEGYMQMRRDG